MPPVEETAWQLQRALIILRMRELVVHPRAPDFPAHYDRSCETTHIRCGGPFVLVPFQIDRVLAINIVTAGII